MLQTKKEKKRFKRKRFSLFLFFLGYIILLLSGLSYIITHKFFPDALVSPISKKQQKSVSSSLDAKKIPYESVEKFDDYYLVKIKDNGEVLISDRKSIEDQVSSLQLITSRLKIEGKKFKRLDFRFDKTVIQF